MAKQGVGWSCFCDWTEFELSAAAGFAEKQDEREKRKQISPKQKQQQKEPPHLPTACCHHVSNGEYKRKGLKYEEMVTNPNILRSDSFSLEHWNSFPFKMNTFIFCF